MGIGQCLDLVFTLAVLAATGLVLWNERVQTPGSEVDLHVDLPFFWGAIREDCVSPKWIPEHLCRARCPTVSHGGICSCATIIVPRKIYAEVVDTSPGLWRKGRDATEVSKDGAFMSGAEWFFGIGWVIVIFYACRG